MSEPGGRVLELRERLTRGARSAGDAVRSSTLPLSALDVDDPILEAALTDSAMHFFLDHMTGLEDNQKEPEDFEPRSERIPEAELAATRRRLDALDAVPPPDLAGGLASECLWILVDLLLHGDALTRQRTTTVIRAAMRRRDLMAAARDEGLATALLSLERRPLLLDLLLHALQPPPPEAGGEQRR